MALFLGLFKRRLNRLLPLKRLYLMQLLLLELLQRLDLLKLMLLDLLTVQEIKMVCCYKTGWVLSV